jgi:hypothetical protein
MKPFVALLFLVACSKPGGPIDPGGPDAATKHPDAAIDAPPSEPKPMFTADIEVGGQLAIDDSGIRSTYQYQGGAYLSVVTLGLTATGSTTSCQVTISPGFVQFGTAHTSTRSFKTVVLDFSTSQMLEDKCMWDDAWILSQLGAQFGQYVVGFAQARFTTDQPNVDVYLAAAMGFGDTANIVRAGGGTAYQMGADGTVTDTVIQPAPGTLLPGLYIF